MSVRVRYKSQNAVSSTINDDNWLGQPESSVLTDLLAAGGTNQYTMEPGDTDIEVKPIKPATVQYLYLKSKADDPNEPLQPLVITLNDTFTLELKPLPGAKEAEWRLCTDAIESIKVTNESDIAIVLIVSLAGT